MIRLLTSLALTLLFVAGCQSPTGSDGEPLALAVDGSTDYHIVLPAEPTPIDTYAAETLAGYLEQITGAAFPIVQAPNDNGPAIYLGLSDKAAKQLGGEPLAGLEQQDYVVRTLGQDLFLYGKGKHASLHAAMDFLKHDLGWRWYSVYENPVIPDRPTVRLKPLQRRAGFDIASRQVAARYQYDFYLQNGINMGFETRYRARGEEYPPHFESYFPTEKFVHTLFAYVPPTPESTYADSFYWQTKRDYFATNPEYFSWWRNGERVPNRQLCFSKPELRATFTQNVLKHIETSGTDQYITIDAADATGPFCYCPGCQALEAQYQSPGGPLYDYLLEICGLLEKKHPEVHVKTLAYRHSQTQIPPVLPAGERLPDNLIVAFAPIEDNYFGDWTHPDPEIQQTYRHLQQWCRLSDQVWVWIYPNPWGTGIEMPVGNVRRLINQARAIHAAGAEGIFTDHSEFNERAGLSELQSYLLYELMQDMDADTDAIIREVTDYQYGPAAPLVRTYIDELEKGREAIRELQQDFNFASSEFNDRTFPYLTLANIHRWNQLFEQMEAKVEPDSNHFINLRLLRRELDFAILWKWLDLQQTHPETYTDYQLVVDRIEATNSGTSAAGIQNRPIGESTLQDFIAVIKGGGKVKPLPERFAEYDQSRIKQYLPRLYRITPKTVIDEDAAFGYATIVHLPDMPLQIGFYQWLSRHPPKGVAGPRLSLDKEDLTPGKYALYELGEITLTPQCWIWFSAQSWQTHLRVGQRLFEPGADNRWRAWISMKVDGPTFGGTASDDQVLVDRIILVPLD